MIVQSNRLNQTRMARITLSLIAFIALADDGSASTPDSALFDKVHAYVTELVIKAMFNEDRVVAYSWFTYTLPVDNRICVFSDDYSADADAVDREEFPDVKADRTIVSFELAGGSLQDMRVERTCSLFPVEEACPMPVACTGKIINIVGSPWSLGF